MKVEPQASHFRAVGRRWARRRWQAGHLAVLFFRSGLKTTPQALHTRG